MSVSVIWYKFLLLCYGLFSSKGGVNKHHSKCKGIVFLSCIVYMYVNITKYLFGLTYQVDGYVQACNVWLITVGIIIV